MIQTLLIMWRETLEAALVVGILLTYLHRSGHRDGVPAVWAGTGLAVLAAILVGIASSDVVSLLDPDTQALIQVGILVTAVGVLSWMVLWMHRHASALRGDLHRKADRAVASGRRVGLATIAFVAVFREGVETVLFLWGVVAQRGLHVGSLSLVGAGLAGAALAVGTAWLFFRGAAFLSLRTFFRTTGILLLLVAAGLLTSAVNQLISLGYLPPIVPQVWNSSWLVRDGSPLGAVLAALMGYRSRPSLLEVLAFVAYFPPMVWALRRSEGRLRPAPARRAPAPAA
jgi:high-affinity iron transporter